MHGPVLIVLVAIAVVGGLFYFVRNRRRTHRTSEASDRSPGASDARNRNSDASDPSTEASDRNAGHERH
jgi:hypothetical protein